MAGVTRTVLRHVQDAPRNSVESMEITWNFAANSQEAVKTNDDLDMGAFLRRARDGTAPTRLTAIISPWPLQSPFPNGSTGDCRGFLSNWSS